MPRFDRHSAVCTGALKNSAGLTEIVLRGRRFDGCRCCQPGQRAVVVVELGLPVDVGEPVEELG